MRSRIMRIATKEIMAMNFSEEKQTHSGCSGNWFFMHPYGIGMDINDYFVALSQCYRYYRGKL